MLVYIPSLLQLTRGGHYSRGAQSLIDDWWWHHVAVQHCLHQIIHIDSQDYGLLLLQECGCKVRHRGGHVQACGLGWQVNQLEGPELGKQLGSLVLLWSHHNLGQVVLLFQIMAVSALLH